jgi:hypothetical protein
MKRLAVIVLLFAPFMGCNKLNPLNYIPHLNDTTPAAVTGLGTPTDTAVSKTIGPSGGTIVSNDGRIEVDIPAGALATTTNITIQPVTNMCPGGSGFAYDLLPNGTKFAVPATFTFHYADSDVNGTDPYLLYLAVQDSLQQWDVDVYRDVDTIAHTVSFDINHFSVRSMLPGLVLTATNVDVSIIAPKTDYFPSEQGKLTMVQNVRTAQWQAPGDDDLPSLPINAPVDKGLVSGWQVYGGSANGTLDANGSKATYTAPSKIDQDRTVTVTANYGQRGFITIVDPTRKSGSTRIVKRTVEQFSKKLNLHPANISFNVKVTVDLTETSGVYPDHYHDESTFRVVVTGLMVTVPQAYIVNQAPTVANPTGSGNGFSATWIPDRFGLIDIVSGKGVVADDVDADGYRIVSLIFVEPNVLGPGWTIVDPAGHTNQEPPHYEEPVPGTMSFELKDGYQVIDPYEGTSGAGRIKYTIESIH